MLKPQLLFFNHHVARWVRAERAGGRHFDLAHQILPRAPRYPSALRNMDVPYVIGSLGGSLPTPPAFRTEAGSAKWFTQLRSLDSLRFRYDPWLRASYCRAELVLGVAPYMRDVLVDVPIRAFEPFLGIGVSDLGPETKREVVARRLRLLHVGRAVRTKGLRDTVRALAHLRDLADVTLTSVGDGEEIEPCRAEAERLGVSDRVEFLGRLPRDQVEDLYRDSDALVFPSFRESMGGVLYEAMRWSLPIITTRRGGPDWIVDENCGLKVDISSPDQLARDLSEAIRRLALDPQLRIQLGKGGREKLRTEALWSIKAQKMCGLYARTVAASSAPGRSAGSGAAIGASATSPG